MQARVIDKHRDLIRNRYWDLIMTRAWLTMAFRTRPMANERDFFNLSNCLPCSDACKQLHVSGPTEPPTCVASDLDLSRVEGVTPEVTRESIVVSLETKHDRRLADHEDDSRMTSRYSCFVPVLMRMR
jgi:hypothetical protein